MMKSVKNKIKDCLLVCVTVPHNQNPSTLIMLRLRTQIKNEIRIHQIWDEIWAENKK
jgi:hypothetical protein